MIQNWMKKKWKIQYIIKIVILEYEIQNKVGVCLILGSAYIFPNLSIVMIVSMSGDGVRNS